LKEILGGTDGVAKLDCSFFPTGVGETRQLAGGASALGLEHVHADHEAVHEVPVVEDVGVGLKVARLVGEVDPPWRPALGF